MKAKHFNITFVADNKYAPYTAVTLQSLFECHPAWEFDVWLLSCNFSEENISKYNKLCQLNNSRFHLLSISQSDLDNYENVGFWSKFTFLKLFIADKLPPSVRYTLYLDSDVLITDSLDELFMIHLEDYSLAAVEDLAFVKEKSISQFGLKDTAICINSGVMLINTEKWRKASELDLYLIFLNKWRNKFYLCDQDIINNVFSEQILSLPLRYNLTHFCFCLHIKKYLLQSHIKQWKSARLHPAIIHFTNNTKPWTLENTHPYKSQYIRIAKRTPYYNIFICEQKNKLTICRIKNTFRYYLLKIIDIFRINL